MKLSKGDIVDDLLRWQKPYLEDIESRNYSENTIELYDRCINVFIEYTRGYNEELELKTLKKMDISRFFLYLDKENAKKNKKLSKNTKSAYLKAIKSFFKFITANNDELYFFDSLFIDLKQKVKKKRNNREFEYFTKEESEKILKILEYRLKKKNNYKNNSISLILKLMMFGGLRISEALPLTLNDIEQEDSKFFTINIVGKGGDEESVLIQSSKIDDEISYFEDNIALDERIFRTTHGSFQTRQNIYLILNNIYKEAKINKRGNHILRHTFAMSLATSGAKVEVIQEALRHSNIEATMVYVHATKDMIKSSLEKI